MITKELLEILCCPKCHGTLQEMLSLQGLLCAKCQLLYQVEDGIPNLLIEEAKPVDATDGEYPTCG